MPTTLSKIWLSVGPIFTVLLITPSFLVRFRPVKYGIELLIFSTHWSRGGQFDPVFGLVHDSVKLGQP